MTKEQKQAGARGLMVALGLFLSGVIAQGFSYWAGVPMAIVVLALVSAKAST